MIDFLYEFDSDDDNSTHTPTSVPVDNISMHIDIEKAGYTTEVIGADIDAVDFWRVNRSRYPLLACVTRCYHVIPATDIPSERLFSTAGCVVSKLRFQMSPEMVSQILF